jgi:hypothetical protein
MLTEVLGSRPWPTLVSGQFAWTEYVLHTGRGSVVRRNVRNTVGEKPAS